MPLYTAVLFCAGMLAFLAIVYSQQRGFRERLLDFIEIHETVESAVVIVKEDTLQSPSFEPTQEQEYTPFTYRSGDWERYVISSGYSIPDEGGSKVVLYKDDDMEIQSYGSMNLDLLYGSSMYTSDKYKQYDDDKPVSRVINSGFEPKQELLLHMEGHVGKRMTIYIDHDSRKKDNQYRVQYKAVSSEEVIQEVNAGEIDIKFNQSKYATYENTTVKGMGVDLTLKKGGLQVKAFGSVLKGESEVDYFRGNSSSGNMRLSEYQYLSKTYYQIEPYIRYNGILVPPYPVNYVLQPVNLNPAGFEVWLDDQNPLNDINATKLPIDGGYYTRLQSGVDYTVNFATGLIRFIRSVPATARIFAAYTLLSGSSTDTGAILPGDPTHPGGIWAGKTLVFIKYGYFIGETGPGDDRNNDGKVNQDVYEVRSFYYVGDKYLLSDNFVLQFYDDNRVLTSTETKSLGRFTVDYSEGIVSFLYREPFREILPAASVPKIYSETQSDRVYEYSRFRLKFDYYREARSFRLSHVNIIPDSTRVKINERVISRSLYSVDHTSGFLTFNNPNNPLIGPETIIEVRYEYLPLAGQSNAFIGGIRTDYCINDSLKLGGSLMYTRSTGTDVIPLVGNTPSQTVVIEGDTTLNLTGKRIADFINIFRNNKIKSVPIEINAYAEYARSYKDINTFGKGLIDNMESADDSLNVSLTERDWILASAPPLVTTRGRLNYYYYRNPSNPGTLRGLDYGATLVSSAVKPGPFNVAYGHLPPSVQTPFSLVLDFDGNGDYLSVATRKIASQAVDLSGLQYLEVSYQYTGATAISLNFDLGTINEDSDADGILDTEDVNRNGVIDSDAERDYSEDSGYDFNDPQYPTKVGGGARLNSYSRGDGVLSTEDLNGNNILDTSEATVSMPTIAIAGGNSSWQTVRVYIDPSSAQIDLLKHVLTVRMSVAKGLAASGRIYVDSIRFVSARWTNATLDGTPTISDRMKVTIVDTINDSEYRAESLMTSQRDLYSSLYGKRNDDELQSEKESALQLTYSVLGGNYVSVTRKFQQPMDIRFYKTMNMWMNFRSFTAGDTVGVIFGSSENDYVEYRIPMSMVKVWREARLKLAGGSDGEYDPYQTVGNPDYKRINFIKLLIYAPGNSGQIWVNDIYLTEPEQISGDAFWVESELKVTDPLYRTDSGVPLFSDIKMKYIYKGHGSKFTTVGQKWNEMAEKSHEVLSSMRILPNWYTSVDYVRQESSTEKLNELVPESRRGATKSDTVYLISDYESDINGVPSVKVSYKYDSYKNDRDEVIASYDVNRKTSVVTHTPLISVNEKIERVLGGTFTARAVMNMLLKEYEIERDSPDLTYESLAGYTSVYEKEKRQRTDMILEMQYTNSLLYVKPSVNIGSEEIVALAGKGTNNEMGIVSDVSSDFHFPFVYNGDQKFVERNKRFGFIAGVQKTKIVAPEYKMEVNYFENRFRDLGAAELSDAEYPRTKGARGYVSTNITVPFSLAQFKAMKFFKGATFTYGRSMNLAETEVPYEGEGTGSSDEKYGIKRSLGETSNGGLNLFRYYPFYYFSGRGNFANGRDYVYRNYNRQITYSNGIVAGSYNNNFRLIDNFSFNTTMDFNFVSVDAGTLLNQIAERQNVYGIPSQVVTYSAHVNLSFDMMKVLHFSFFRPNQPGRPYHSSNLVLGYNFSDNMIITSNIEEYMHTPSAELNFRRDRMNLAFRFGLGVRKRHQRSFISPDDGSNDSIYLTNLNSNLVYRELDYTYTFSTIFETDVVWLYNFFMKFYQLVSYPIFSIEYSMAINRYNYLAAVSPEPYDLHLVKLKLTLDLHRNVQGGLFSRFALEQFRNRETGGISREIFSFELGLNFTLIF